MLNRTDRIELPYRTENSHRHYVNKFTYNAFAVVLISRMKENYMIDNHYRAFQLNHSFHCLRKMIGYALKHWQHTHI